MKPNNLRKLTFGIIIILILLIIFLHFTGLESHLIQAFIDSVPIFSYCYLIVIMILSGSRVTLLYLEGDRWSKTGKRQISQGQLTFMSPLGDFGPMANLLIESIFSYTCLYTATSVLRMLAIGRFSNDIPFDGLIVIGIIMILLMILSGILLASLVKSIWSSPLFIETTEPIPTKGRKISALSKHQKNSN